MRRRALQVPDGLEREDQVRELLRDWGWSAIQAAQDPVHVVACVTEGDAVHPRAPDRLTFITRACLYIRVETTQRPFERLGPLERRMLREMARRAGAELWLCWWPPDGSPTWVSVKEWPLERFMQMLPHVG